MEYIVSARKYRPMTFDAVVGQAALTTTEDGWQNLMLLGRRKDEDDVCGRLFKGFQKSVEGCCGEHMYLVNDEHLVTAQLRWDPGLFHERLDVLHGVVTGSVELKDVQ